MPKAADIDRERIAEALKHFTPEQIIGAYVARYPEAYAFTREYEGGYVNDPDDPGGCTNMGITIGTLRDWRKDQSLTCADVQALSEDEAAMIYAVNYWRPVWGSQLPIGVNTQVWDFGVNAGPSRAIKYLQKCVGTSQDGIMGPKTLEATQKSNIDNLLVRYHDERQRYYQSLSTYSKYGKGWTNRNNDCLALSQRLRKEGPNKTPDLVPPQPDALSDSERIAALEVRMARVENTLYGPDAGEIS